MVIRRKEIALRQSLTLGGWRMRVSLEIPFLVSRPDFYLYLIADLQYHMQAHNHLIQQASWAIQVERHRQN